MTHNINKGNASHVMWLWDFRHEG